LKLSKLSKEIFVKFNIKNGPIKLVG